MGRCPAFPNPCQPANPDCVAAAIRPRGRDAPRIWATRTASPVCSRPLTGCGAARRAARPSEGTLAGRPPTTGWWRPYWATSRERARVGHVTRMSRSGPARQTGTGQSRSRQRRWSTHHAPVQRVRGCLRPPVPQRAPRRPCRPGRCAGSAGRGYRCVASSRCRRDPCSR